MKLLIALSGASGVSLGLKAIEWLPEAVDPFVILSEHAKVVYAHEEGGTLTLPQRARVLGDHDIAAPVASGSYNLEAMLLAPCSMNTLAKIACGIADTLTTRAAAVMIKERRTLVLAPREMPLDAIALENMLKLARLGVVIAPPIAGYYAQNQSLEEMERFVVGKWYDQLKIPHRLFRRWGQDDNPNP